MIEILVICFFHYQLSMIQLVDVMTEQSEKTLGSNDFAKMSGKKIKAN
jgi:hypothetical protein